MAASILMFHFNLFPSGRTALMLLFLAVPELLTAQVMTPQSLGTHPSEDIPPSTSQPVATPSPPPIDEGRAVSPNVRRLHYELKLDLRTAYDDNILLSARRKIGDFNTRIDPSIALSLGDQSGEANRLHFQYNPDIVLFFDHSEFDTLQHVIHLDGQSNLGRLKLGLSEDAQFLNGTDVNQATNTGTFVNAVNLDVRGQPDVNTFDTQLTAAYDLTGKTSLSGAFQWSISDYSQFISSERISGSLYFNYIYGPKLTIGAGGLVGSELVDGPTTDQTFEQINVRASYELTGKLMATGSFGIEIRQFDTGRGDYVSPVFELGIDYTPFDGTIFNLSGSRRTTNSASLAGQDFTSTQLTASVRQRLFQRFFVSLTGGYQNQTYFGTTGATSSARDDNYYFIQPAIDVKITRYWYGGGFYLHRQNESSASSFSFNENQVGVRATFTF